MIYKCGCEASGDNVALYCPLHGDAEDLSLGAMNSEHAQAFGQPGYRVIGTAWQPISTAPKDTDVLVCDKNGITIVASLKPYGWELAESDDLWISTPLFWMELPKAPEGLK